VSFYYQYRNQQLLLEQSFEWQQQQRLRYPLGWDGVSSAPVGDIQGRQELDFGRQVIQHYHQPMEEWVDCRPVVVPEEGVGFSVAVGWHKIVEVLDADIDFVAAADSAYH